MLADPRLHDVEDVYLSGPQTEDEAGALAAVLDALAPGATVVIHLDDEASEAVATRCFSPVLAAAQRRGVRVALAGHSAWAALNIERLLAGAAHEHRPARPAAGG